MAHFIAFCVCFMGMGKHIPEEEKIITYYLSTILFSFAKFGRDYHFSLLQNLLSLVVKKSHDNLSFVRGRKSEDARMVLLTDCFCQKNNNKKKSLDKGKLQIVTKFPKINRVPSSLIAFLTNINCPQPKQRKFAILRNYSKYFFFTRLLAN